MYLEIWSIWVADTNKERMLMCLGIPCLNFVYIIVN